ncbi:MAG TPA: RNA methyltransferase [Pseudomonadales bacterium]|nr:RNA methyltransferase [Pseudomonadales bacterium]
MNQAFLDRVRIVLVNTSHPGNIGGTARAMKNMGLTQLYLVDPRKYPHDEATRRASNAEDILDAAVVVGSVEEALAGCDLVIGTSARERRIPWPLKDPRACVADAGSPRFSKNVAILFGREHSGLTNEELAMCQLHMHIPTNPDYSSLNLAAAVQVVAYECRMWALEAAIEVGETAGWDMPLADAADVERMHQHMAQTLASINFIDPDNPKQALTRLRRMFARIRPDEMEISILRGMLNKIDRAVDKNKAD